MTSTQESIEALCAQLRANKLKWGSAVADRTAISIVLPSAHTMPADRHRRPLHQTPKRKARSVVDLRDVPATDAARRLGLDVDTFTAKLPNLIERGFPRADPDTGCFDLIAVDRWCDTRHPHLFGGNAAKVEARDANVVAMERIAKLRGPRRE